MKNKNGESVGYGLINSILKEKVTKLEEMLKQYPNKESIYTVIQYWGAKQPKDPNNKPYYAFSDPTLYPVTGEIEAKSSPLVTVDEPMHTGASAHAAFTNDEIPF
jgi:hypothetical protein